jgi:hypothetical protein
VVFENRPFVVTSKPVNGEWPGLEVFTLLAASCPIHFALAFEKTLYFFSPKRKQQHQSLRFWESAATS